MSGIYHIYILISINFETLAGVFEISLILQNNFHAFGLHHRCIWWPIVANLNLNLLSNHFYIITLH